MVRGGGKYAVAEGPGAAGPLAAPVYKLTLAPRSHDPITICPRPAEAVVRAS
jgi:hypothetical protein